MDPQLIQEFCKVTSAPKEQAEYFLDVAGGNLQDAIALYFDDAGSVPRPHAQAETAPARPQPQERQDAASASAPKQTGVSGSAAAGGAASSKAKFGTLSSVKPNESSSDEEEGQAFYAGGSEHGSGQQIVGPKKGKPTESKKVVSKLFSAARELGAEEENEDQMQQNRGPAAFSGAGYRLGTTADPSPAPTDSRLGASSSSSNASSKANETEVALKFWSNGFSIDDGPLRSFDDPQNAEFLQAIRRGEVPTELRSLKRSANDRVAVRLEDHHQEEYHAPKVTVKPFTGAGQKLSSDESKPAGQARAGAAVAPLKITVNESQPTTQIQLRLPNGSRTTLRCNQSNTLRDVRAHLLAENSDLQAASFTFASAFPGKPIADEQQTVKDAGLLNAALVIKLG